jgi:peptidoglycan/LPS O-acetylase OafA/YrhL
MAREPNPPGAGRGGIWVVVGAAMLCPACKLVLLVSAGGALGGLLSNAWFLAGAFVVIAASAWLAFRLIRRRLVQRGQPNLLRCGDPSAAASDAPTAAGEVKERASTRASWRAR